MFIERDDFQSVITSASLTDLSGFFLLVWL